MHDRIVKNSSFLYPALRPFKCSIRGQGYDEHFAIVNSTMTWDTILDALPRLYLPRLLEKFLGWMLVQRFIPLQYTAD
jgi:hypothetical protein